MSSYVIRIMAGAEGRTMRDKACDVKDYRIMAQCAFYSGVPWVKRLVSAYQGMTEAEQRIAEGFPS